MTNNGWTGGVNTILTEFIIDNSIIYRNTFINIMFLKYINNSKNKLYKQTIIKNFIISINRWKWAKRVYGVYKK